MRPEPEMILLLIDAADALKGSQKRLFIRISAAEVRRRLINKKGYTDEELPTQQTINTKLNLLGYRLTKVAKCRPQKGSRRPTPSSSG